MKAPREIRPSDLDWPTNVVVRDPGSARTGAFAARRGGLRQALARLRQLARFFYTLFTES